MSGCYAKVVSSEYSVFQLYSAIPPSQTTSLGVPNMGKLIHQGKIYGPLEYDLEKDFEAEIVNNSKEIFGPDSLYIDVKKKIGKAFCVDGKVDDNGLLAIVRYIIFRKLEDEGKAFVIERPEEYGGNISFKSYQEVEDKFASSELSSIDLKQGLATELISFLAPLQELIEKNKVLIEEAYPN